MKRTAEGIFERGGFIRKIENLGSRALPYKISKHGQVHKQGHAMLMHFDVSFHQFSLTVRKLIIFNIF